MNEEDKQKLRAKLRARISEKQIGRSDKKQQKQVLKDTLKKMGIDTEEFMKNLEIVNRGQKQQAKK